MTKGQQFTAEIRRYFHIGPRTRQTTQKREAIWDAINNECSYPGYYNTVTGEALRSAYGAAYYYSKHIDGYRMSGDLIAHIRSLSMWQFTAMLGKLIDDCSCAGEAEVWFQQMAREVRQAA